MSPGIYFALNASYSIRFAKQCKMMFIARVLCGTSTLGKEHFTRPPVDVRTGRLFDSCLDSDKQTYMYIIFDNSQVYPELLVEF